MRKILLFLCLIVSAFGFASCSCSSDKSAIVYAEKSISIYENESYTIDERNIEISGESTQYIVYILDENIAKIDNNIVTPVSVGKTKIRFQIEDKKDVFFDVDFEVKLGKIAKSVSIEKSMVNIDMSEGVLTSLNRITVNNESDEIPTIICDNNIVNYDYTTGVVTAVGVGSTIVQINYLKCSVFFEVNVTKNFYVTYMTANDCKVYANSTGKLPFQIYPSNANTYTFSLSEKDKDRDDFIVYADGTYKSFGETNITLNYFFYTDKNQRSEMFSFDVEIVEKITDFEYVIKDEKGAICNNYIVDCEYTLIIQVDNELGTPALQINGGFAETSSTVYMVGVGYQMRFKYNSIGTKKIHVTYLLSLGNVQNSFTKTIDLEIVDKSVIKIGGKWLSMTLEPNNLGKYEIYLDGLDGSRANNITIMLEINGIFDTNLQYTVYKIVSETNKVEIDKTFVPEETGEYTFEVFLEGESVGKIIVLVR